MTVHLGPIDQATRWVNSPPLTAEALSGRVVLVDFWEYTCVNWIRTSPYVKAWHRDYARLGLHVIGVHAPEFEFGQRTENIDQGIRDHGLTYPIAIDNDYAIWRGLGNNAWPAKYLFDGQGDLVDRWVGEGSYDDIEAELRRRLGVDEAQLPPISPEAMAYERAGEPNYAGITEETYVGGDRREPGTFTVAGDWRGDHEYVELRDGPGELVLPFTAGEVNLVLQPGSSGASAVRVLLDGQPLDGAHGADVGPDGVARVDRAGMVRLIDHAPAGPHVLSLVADDPGLRAYVFTFGP
jgi:hypothetical protein